MPRRPPSRPDVDPARLDTLTQIEAALWRELGRAAQASEHPWRVAVLATRDGERADARSVVLREVEVGKRRLVVYTDARSTKVRQIEAHPEGVIVMWSQALSWQLRLAVRLEVASSGLSVSSRWARLKMTPAAQDYLSPLPPGSTIEHPLPERGSREFFALIVAHVQSIDWLELHAEGQRRAAFDARGARWLVP
jgi:pyridoxamine 5'-phosphate oxidase